MEASNDIEGKKKIEAIKCYKSVFENKNNNYSKYFESIMGRAKFRGEIIGVDYAEAFVVAKKKLQATN